MGPFHAVSIASVLLLAGCGLSPEYRYNQLKSVSDYDVCHALSDPRANSIGAGWSIRRDAAVRVASERRLTCDREMFARIHALEGPSRDAAVGNSLMMMQQGIQMMSPQPQPPGLRAPLGGGVQSGTAFLKGSYVSGMNRICNYDRVGSAVAITVGAAELCPLTIP
jgi:hypothetical protein